MTQEPIIDKLERLEREATGAPWIGSSVPTGRKYGVVSVRTPDGGGRPLAVLSGIPAGKRHADTQLIAEVRNALPALLSQLREQRERADELEHHVDALTQDRNLYVQKWTETDLARLAAERTVRELREALERIAAMDVRHAEMAPAVALAALAPNTEGEGT